MKTGVHFRQTDRQTDRQVKSVLLVYDKMNKNEFCLR